MEKKALENSRYQARSMIYDESMKALLLHAAATLEKYKGAIEENAGGEIYTGQELLARSTLDAAIGILTQSVIHDTAHGNGLAVEEYPNSSEHEVIPKINLEYRQLHTDPRILRQIRKTHDQVPSSTLVLNDHILKLSVEEDNLIATFVRLYLDKDQSDNKLPLDSNELKNELGLVNLKTLHQQVMRIRKKMIKFLTTSNVDVLAGRSYQQVDIPQLMDNILIKTIKRADGRNAYILNDEYFNIHYMPQHEKSN